MTREDSRELTAQRLLDAGQKLVSKSGLDATSVEDIAAAAGYSRGAFYSNFASKHDLFIELLRRDHQRGAAEFLALQNDTVPLEQIRLGARECYSRLYRNNESFMNWSEARMLAARDPKFRVKLAGLIQEKRDQIAGFIDYFCRRGGSPPPAPPEAMAMGFMSLVEGVKLFMLSSPMDMTPETAESMLTLFIDSIMTMSLREGGSRA